MQHPPRFVLLVGAAASSVITAYVGWYGARVLIVPFLAWVISPFVLLWWALARASRWAPSAARVLSATAIVVSAACVAAYIARLLWPPRFQGAFVFVIVPPLAWLVIGLAMVMARAPARQRP